MPKVDDKQNAKPNSRRKRSGGQVAGLTTRAIVPGKTDFNALLDNLENAAARHWQSADTGREERAWYLRLLESCGRERSGHVAYQAGEPKGFIIRHVEKDLGALDALYVHDEVDRPRVATRLIRAAETALLKDPSVRHIRNQFYVWPEDYITAPFISLGYRVVMRCNQSLEVAAFKPFAKAPRGYRTAEWSASFKKAAVGLVTEAYKNGEDVLFDRRELCRKHVAKRLNEIFKNEVRPYSTLLFHRDELAGLLLAVKYKTGESHFLVIQELCVKPALRRLGLGSFLMQTTLQRMKDAGESAVHLTVTEVNENAKHLYEAAGFRTTVTLPYAYKTL